jgi:hypothetical protein
MLHQHHVTPGGSGGGAYQFHNEPRINTRSSNSAVAEDRHTSHWFRQNINKYIYQLPRSHQASKSKISNLFQISALLPILGPTAPPIYLFWRLAHYPNFPIPTTIYFQFCCFDFILLYSSRWYKGLNYRVQRSRHVILGPLLLSLHQFCFILFLVVWFSGCQSIRYILSHW